MELSIRLMEIISIIICIFTSNSYLIIIANLSLGLLKFVISSFTFNHNNEKIMLLNSSMSLFHALVSLVFLFGISVRV